jgi:hypothetical protein
MGWLFAHDAREETVKKHKAMIADKTRMFP